MNQEKDDIELLIARCEQMRQAQRDYFDRRMPADKKLAMALEKDVDQLCRQLRRKGYDPDRFKSSTEQKRLF